MSLYLQQTIFTREEKKLLLEELTEVLTVNEAATLVAKISEKKCSVTKGKRFGMLPIHDWGAYERMLRLEASHWDSTEIKFMTDYNDFQELTVQEQTALTTAFAFFAVGDGTISSMLAYQMIVTADNFEKQCYYITQLNNEKVHAETYGNMIFSLVPDPQQRDAIFNAVENVAPIKAMNGFIEESSTYPDGDKQLFINLACAEYVMFTPLFCIIFWFRAYRPKKLLQIIFSNELIAKDECEHCVNGCKNYNELPAKDKYTDEQIWEIVDSVVALVCNFANYLVNEKDVNLTGLSLPSLHQYVRFVADDLLVRVNHQKKYNVVNPFDFMNYTDLVPKTNFYEGTVGEYARFNVKEAMQATRDLMNGAHAKGSKDAKAKTKKKSAKF